MKVTFWLSAIAIVYVYVGYPLALAAWARLAPHARSHGGGGVTGLPGVSVLLAVRNEEARLPSRIENLLGLDYPSDRLEIVVVSNGSTDETPGVLARYRGRIRFYSLDAGSKAAALNLAAAAASHDILVFADARQRFAADTVRRLVEPFSDPGIGGVSGELVLDSEAEPTGGNAASDSAVGEGVGLYWRYEKWLRRRESEVHSVLGATGAVYALRRSLWRPLPAVTLLDDVLAPMRAILAGRRIIFAPAARAFDKVSPDAATEERRKERTLAGNYQLLWLEPRLLVPGVNPVWLQFVSHKLGRLVVPYALVALIISNTALASSGPVYGAALALQVAFYLLAAHGALVVGDARPSEASRAVGEASRAVGKELAGAQVD